MEKLSIRSEKSGNINCLFHVFHLEALGTFHKSTAKCHEFKGETSLSAWMILLLLPSYNLHPADTFLYLGIKLGERFWVGKMGKKEKETEFFRSLKQSLWLFQWRLLLFIRVVYDRWMRRQFLQCNAMPLYMSYGFLKRGSQNWLNWGWVNTEWERKYNLILLLFLVQT